MADPIRNYRLDRLTQQTLPVETCEAPPLTACDPTARYLPPEMEDGLPGLMKHAAYQQWRWWADSMIVGSGNWPAASRWDEAARERREGSGGIFLSCGGGSSGGEKSGGASDPTADTFTSYETGPKWGKTVSDTNAVADKGATPDVSAEPQVADLLSDEGEAQPDVVPDKPKETTSTEPEDSGGIICEWLEPLEGGGCPKDLEGKNTQQLYIDNDKDGYAGNETTKACWPVNSCAIPPNPDDPKKGFYKNKGADCKDDETTEPLAANIYPGATEICNGKDDDCANGFDDDVQVEDGFSCTIDECVEGEVESQLVHNFCDDFDESTDNYCAPGNLADEDNDGCIFTVGNNAPTVNLKTPADGAIGVLPNGDQKFTAGNEILFDFVANDPEQDPLTCTMTIEEKGVGLITSVEMWDVAGAHTASAIAAVFSPRTDYSWSVTCEDGKGGSASASYPFEFTTSHKGLKLWLRLNDGSGAQAKDFADDIPNAVPIFGNATWDGEDGLLLKGQPNPEKNAYLLVENNALFDDPKTFEAHIKPEKYGFPLFDKLDGAISPTKGNPSPGYFIAASSNENLVWTINNYAPDDPQKIDEPTFPSAGYIPLGEWTHLVFVRQNFSCLLYINGQEFEPLPCNGTPFTNAMDLAIGANVNTTIEGGVATLKAYEWFFGTMGEISIYNRDLSADEVDYLCNKSGQVGCK